MGAETGALMARRVLQVETPDAVSLTLKEVAAFVEKCRSLGIPEGAELSSPEQDMLRRFPIKFAVTWIEAL